jgi:hypothetical protein
MEVVDRNLLQSWIDHCFYHPVEEEAWYWDIDEPEWTEPPRGHGASDR